MKGKTTWWIVIGLGAVLIFGLQPGFAYHAISNVDECYDDPTLNCFEDDPDFCEETAPGGTICNDNNLHHTEVDKYGCGAGAAATGKIKGTVFDDQDSILLQWSCVVDGGVFSLNAPVRGTDNGNQNADRLKGTIGSCPAGVCKTEPVPPVGDWEAYIWVSVP